MLFDSPRQALGFLRDLAVALSIPVLALCLLLQPFQVQGSSMQPLLSDGERILVDRVTPLLAPRTRGEVVVLRHPGDAGRFLVKRIVGLPGETLRIAAGVVLIDGRPLQESYLPAKADPGDEFGPLTLGPNQFFVLGDHRTDSEDSRLFGPVGAGEIYGKAVAAYWPLSAAGSL